jgi:hypothetical protein
MHDDDIEQILENCDYNGNNTVTRCEIFDCMMEYENNWRVENCDENYPSLYC